MSSDISQKHIEGNADGKGRATDGTNCTTDGISVVKQEAQAGSVALFAGTFDPLTNGHKSIIDRSLGIFGEVIVAIGVNPGKHSMFTAQQREEYIKKVYEGNLRVKVLCYDGLTTDLAVQMGARVLVRGVRSVKDFEYERDLADINRRISGIDTMLFFTDAEQSAVSSSLVRELISYGKDVSEFVPMPLPAIIQ